MPRAELLPHPAGQRSAACNSPPRDGSAQSVPSINEVLRGNEVVGTGALSGRVKSTLPDRRRSRAAAGHRFRQPRPKPSTGAATRVADAGHERPEFGTPRQLSSRRSADRRQRAVAASIRGPADVELLISAPRTASPPGTPGGTTATPKGSCVRARSTRRTSTGTQSRPTRSCAQRDPARWPALPPRADAQHRDDDFERSPAGRTPTEPRPRRAGRAPDQSSGNAGSSAQYPML
jgi:hypothetical protein